MSPAMAEASSFILSQSVKAVFWNVINVHTNVMKKAKLQMKISVFITISSTNNRKRKFLKTKRRVLPGHSQE
jgi:hypothetical protein